MMKHSNQAKGNQFHSVELLAPAGSYECMRAAVNAGADAVYMGGSRFGARAFADNPEQDALLQAIDWMHVRGKKLYLTVNTLLKEAELTQELEGFLIPLYRHGLDAVIVQDVGVIRFLTERFPKLPIHLSTQMTINSAEAVKTVLDLAGQSGREQITRFVPSRELSLEEIKQLREHTDLEIETFIHGALCYSYSGQCLMSSLIGGRSGNRGRCAQPCRLPYQYMQPGKQMDGVKAKYAISPKDICTLDILPELMEAGIDSFKIEGRMKGTGYVSGVTEGYRRCIDLYEELGSEAYRSYLIEHPQFISEIKERFMDLYNRGSFSHGFYDCIGGKSMMADKRPNHNGVLVGVVKQVRGINAGILLSRDIDAQDILEIRSQEEKLYEFTVGTGEKEGNLFCTNFLPGTEVRPGMQVYRTRNQSLLNELEEKYFRKDIQIGLRGQFRLRTGEEPVLTVRTQDGIVVTVSGDVAQAAQNQPMTEEKIKEKLSKTGDTPFVFEKLDVETDGQSFCPVGKLNELRRTALEQMETAITKQYHREADVKSETRGKHLSDDAEKSANREKWDEREATDKCVERNNPETRIQALVSAKEQLDAALQVTELADVYLDITDWDESELLNSIDKIKAAGKQCYLAMPRILRVEGLRTLTQLESLLSDDKIDGYLIRNMDCYPMIKRICEECPDKILMTDYNLYVMNRSARAFWEQGIQHVTAPMELSGKELKELDIKGMVLPVYGRVAFMVTAQCPNRLAGKCNKGEKERKSVGTGRQTFLTDRLSKQLPIASHCKYCFATIHNSEVYSLAGSGHEVLDLQPYAVRMDFSFENGKETECVIKTFVAELRHGIIPDKSFFFRQTKGNFIRGVQ